MDVSKLGKKRNLAEPFSKRLFDTLLVNDFWLDLQS